MMFYVVNTETRKVVGRHSTEAMAILNAKPEHEVVESSEKVVPNDVLMMSDNTFTDNPDKVESPPSRNTLMSLSDRITALEQQMKRLESQRN